MSSIVSPRSPLWSAQVRPRDIAGKQIVMERGEGAYLFDTEGRRYFDTPSGLWYTAIGHSNEEMAQVAGDQVRRLETHHVFQRFLNDRAIELSEKLATISPIQDPKIILTSGGAESIEYALKLARQHWQLRGKQEKTFVLSRENAYHGLHAFGTSITGLPWNRDGYGTPSLVPDTALVSHEDLAAVEARVHEIGAHKIAAIIAEPIIGSGGILPPAPGYLEGLQRIARDNDILFILDEVITGFGRTGRWFATDRWELEPDMVVFAKGVTSGYAPLGGVFVAPQVWEPFFSDAPDAPIYRHGVTYSGHALASALAIKNLEVIEREGLVQRAADLEIFLGQELQRLANNPHVSDIRVSGFAAGVELHDVATANAAIDASIERGVITRMIGTKTLHICPPFVSTEDELRNVVSVFEEAITTAGGAV
ncbi:aminotransferase family protein [Leucobacter sp. USHLN153]|uniref:aminotransferase family protein n=1 Tax=Leucobacter sp. USHLN153 TaxID=3081268 RepID=UPI0030167C02